ncbi:RNA polymerase II accessory factor, Cdc73 [Artemisia annua]|uniref:RNA polymerase II accessory factor, Cdc73 n=1 Tax=Artemisia annua TaxID=35608 RepID=A0A2U1PV17_ARTAN|nr:RNA polymerase II accessory factor, Cdc73 [Artemisia annua]
MDPLTTLRDFTMNNNLHKITKNPTTNTYQFTPTLSFPAQLETSYRSKQGNFYTLETLVYFINNINIKHHDYIRNAGTQKIPAVTLLDRKPLIEYLNGRTEIQFDYIRNPNLNIALTEENESVYDHEEVVKDGGDGNGERKSPMELVREMERPLKDRETILECRNKDFYGVFVAASKRDEEGRKDGVVGKVRAGEGNEMDGGIPKSKMMKGSKIGDGVPIILVPSASQTLITIYNVKEFLEDGVFVPSDVKMKQMKGPKPDCVTVVKKFSSRDKVVTAYEVRDKPSALKAEEWGRVVAVFVLGKEWQFKDWPFKDHVEIFNKILGFYMRFEDDSIESAKTAKQWNVKIISISKNKRHQDRAAALDVWDRLEEFVRSRSRS